MEQVHFSDEETEAPTGDRLRSRMRGDGPGPGPSLPVPEGPLQHLVRTTQLGREVLWKVVFTRVIAVQESKT